MAKAKKLAPIILIFTFLIYSCFLLFNNAKAANINAADVDAAVDRLLSPEHVKGEMIIKFKGEVAADNLVLKQASSLVHSRTGAMIKKEFRGVRGLQLVKTPDNVNLRQALRDYLLEPQIEYAEPNYIVHADVMPDDVYFTNLWGLNNTGQTGGTSDADIDAPEAWDITTGSSSVVIAIVDTGVAYNHPDLSANIWTNSGETSCTDGIDNDGNGYIDDCRGWDFIGDDNDPTDYAAHGTHVAGTIAATGNNALGITGVMWHAQLMPLRFLGVGGSGTTADAVSAILYANAKGAHVINNSWGGTGYSQALKDAIDASPAVVVCAAGNSGTNNDSTLFYPASYTSPNIISVAATDHNDTLAYFSNYGVSTVDLAAPGVNIYSTVPVFSYGAPITVYSQNFNSVSGNLSRIGWRRGGTNSTWAITTGTGYGGTNGLEDSPGGNYLANTSSWAGYMTPIASVKDNLYTLSFKWKGVLENNFDYLDINYSLDGINWGWVDYRTGTTSGTFISDSSTGLTSAADMSGSFYFGFGLSADPINHNDGVYIDDVTLDRRSISISSYGYSSYQGTSMASPHVSGVAGLIKAFNPALTSGDVKNAILNNVDVKASLSGKVLTGGRLNAFNALNSLPCSNQPVRILRIIPVYYSTLQSAYDAAVDGETVQSRAVSLTESPIINLNKSVILTGGYNCDYSSNTGNTILNGDINIISGTLAIENFELK